MLVLFNVTPFLNLHGNDLLLPKSGITFKCLFCLANSSLRTARYALHEKTYQFEALCCYRQLNLEVIALTRVKSYEYSLSCATIIEIRPTYELNIILFKQLAAFGHVNRTAI